jgi:hypothetical protein
LPVQLKPVIRRPAARWRLLMRCLTLPLVHASSRCRYLIIAGEYHAALLFAASEHGTEFIRAISTSAGCVKAHTLPVSKFVLHR